jgi:type II secretory ATPase GspE/PulE/Tfp pilus assembly ATPase PilB-like protein
MLKYSKIKWINSSSQKTENNLQLTEPDSIFSENLNYSDKEIRKLSDITARNLLNVKEAIRYEFLPLIIKQEGLQRWIYGVTSKEFNSDSAQAIRFATDAIPNVVTSIERNRLIKIITSIYNQDSTTPLTGITTITEYSESKEKKIKKIIETVIKYAISRSASDIHIVPEKNGTYIKLRINTETFSHPTPLCDLTFHQLLVGQIRALAKLDHLKYPEVQDSNIVFDTGINEINLRLSIIPTVFGDRIVLRLHHHEIIQSLEDLNLPHNLESLLLNIKNINSGIIFVCGATGSGKTTLLYSLASEIAKSGKIVISIEDPVERKISGISQIDIRNLSYEECIKATLRQNPDVIIIGEIRNSALAQLAFETALTGHLVITTTHSSTCGSLIRRFQEWGISKELIINTFLIGICIKLIKIEDTLSDNIEEDNVKVIPITEFCYSNNRDNSISSLDVATSWMNFIDNLKFSAYQDSLQLQYSAGRISNKIFQEILAKHKFADKI